MGWSKELKAEIHVSAGEKDDGNFVTTLKLYKRDKEGYPEFKMKRLTRDQVEKIGDIGLLEWMDEAELEYKEFCEKLKNGEINAFNMQG